MAKALPKNSDAGSVLVDEFAGLHVHDIKFVVHRAADPHWTIRDLVYPATHTLVWASAGGARYTVSDEPIRIRAGQMMLFPAGVRRSAASDPLDPWTFDSVGFTLAGTAGGVATERLATLPRLVTRDADADVARAIHELDRQWHEHGPGSQLRCRGIVSQLFGQYVQAATADGRAGARRPVIDAVVELLRRTTHRLYSADELAARAGLSPSRFRVLFRQATGTSAVRFQNGLRVRRAAGLLRSGEHSVTDVAGLVGYQDLFYFSRQFKQFTGVPPSAYLAR